MFFGEWRVVTLGVLMSGRTFFLKGFRAQAHNAGGVRGSLLWRGSFPERLSRKEALGIVCCVCIPKRLWTGVLKTYLTYCTRLREEMRRWPGRKYGAEARESENARIRRGLPSGPLLLQITGPGVVGIISVALFPVRESTRGG